MTLFVEELNHFFILPISELILDYSHFSRKIKLISRLPFKRYYVYGQKKLIKYIEFVNESSINIYYQDQKEYVVMNFFISSTLDSRLLSEPLGLHQMLKVDTLSYCENSWIFHSYVPPKMVVEKQDFSALYECTLDIHHASLGWYYIFKKCLFVLDTWKGIIQVYKISTDKNNNFPLTHSNQINISKFIYQSRYSHTLHVASDIIMISGGDTLWILDQFGNELITFDLPGKDPAFILQNTYLFIIIKNFFFKYQFI